MKRIHIVGKDLEKVSELKEELARRGLVYVEENPEIVISYGGDGMFLIAERKFPGVPKISVRDSDVGNMACGFGVGRILDSYLSGVFEIEEIRKLKGVYRGRFEQRELIGTNDIVIRNSLPTEALRFRYRINGGDWSEVFIGDGVVVSTAYGSNKGAYFYSIAGHSFRDGIGVAFNNVTGDVAPLFLLDNDSIEVEVVRGVGVLVADNNRDFINLESGDRIVVGGIDDVARRIVLKNESED